METNSQLIKVLSRNILASWFGHFVAAITAFFLTPFVLQHLGLDQFGVWALITGFTGYYGLLDIGFRSGLTRYITRYIARNDDQRISEIGSTGTAVLIVCGSVVFVMTLVLALVFPIAFTVNSEHVTASRWAILLLGTSISLQFPFFVQSAIFVATQRFDISNAIGVAETLSRAVAIILVLYLDGGIIGLAASVSCTSLFYYLVRFYFARRLVPNLVISRMHVKKRAFKELFGYSVWSTINQFSRLLLSTSDLYIIGAISITSAVGRFELANRVASQYSQLFNPFGNTMFPALVHVGETSGNEKVIAVYFSASYILTLLLAQIGIIGWLWAPEFYRLWLANQAEVLANGVEPAAIFRILVIAAAIRTSQNISHMIFFAFNRLEILSIAFIAEALTNVVLSVVLYWQYGLLGVAMASVICAAIYQLGLIPFLVARILGVSVISIHKAVFLRAIAPVGMFFLGIVLCRYYAQANSWIALILAGLVGTIWMGICSWTIGLPADVKEKIVLRLSKIFKK